MPRKRNPNLVEIDGRILKKEREYDEIDQAFLNAAASRPPHERKSLENRLLALKTECVLLCRACEIERAHRNRMSPLRDELILLDLEKIRIQNSGRATGSGKGGATVKKEAQKRGAHFIEVAKRLLQANSTIGERELHGIAYKKINEKPPRKAIKKKRRARIARSTINRHLKNPK